MGYVSGGQWVKVGGENGLPRAALARRGHASDCREPLGNTRWHDTWHQVNMESYRGEIIPFKFSLNNCGSTNEKVSV